MAILQCKMCGGRMTVLDGSVVAECEYCGTLQTIPLVDDEKKLKKFDRANRLRMASEFDKASGIYETIVEDFPEEAEAYWGLVLCKYGIEYVDDPATEKKIPTCHRTSFSTVMEDSDYQQTLENSNQESRKIYRAEAKQIEELRKRIIEVSSHEDPFDIFICYKETDDKGNRTLDSVLAQDIYNALTDKGYRVFFSRITLEDKLGHEYEPYIFSALNSAKIMLAVGTDYEHYNAVWVKNEWSRFLQLMAKDNSRHLIACYKGLDAYDMPQEFAKLQAQDLGKVGALQDLLRGVEKLLPKENVKPGGKATANQTADITVKTLLERGYFAIEDDDWAAADGFFEKILYMESRNAQAYLGKALVAERCGNLDELAKHRIANSQACTKQKIRLPADNDYIQAAIKKYHIPNYTQESEICEFYQTEMFYYSEVPVRQTQKSVEEQYWATHKLLARASSFGDEKMKKDIADAKAKVFDWLDECIKEAKNEEDRANAQKKAEYKQFLRNADQLAENVNSKALVKMEEDYKTFKLQMLLDLNCDSLKETADNFHKLGDFRDSKQRRDICLNRIIKIVRFKRNVKIAGIVFIILAVLGLMLAKHINQTYIQPAQSYKKAETLLEEARFDAAISIFEELGDYKDSAERIAEVEQVKTVWTNSKYEEANQYFEKGDLYHAAFAFAQLGDYLDAYQRSRSIWAELTFREKLSAGGSHTVAIMNDGYMFCAGNNDFGQCDLWEFADAVSTGRLHTVALLPTGNVIAVGFADDGQCNVDRWEDIVAVSAGEMHTVGLKMDGTVVAVGSNDKFQCHVDHWFDIIAISAGGFHTVGLKADGTVVASGSNNSSQCEVGDWTDIIAVSAGYQHTVGLKANGTVVAAGRNRAGECDVDDWTDIIAISAGMEYTVGLKADGTVVAVGLNNYGNCDLSSWRDIIAISAGESHVVGLKKDGTVVAAGDNSWYQCEVAEWNSIGDD